MAIFDSLDTDADFHSAMVESIRVGASATKIFSDYGDSSLHLWRLPRACAILYSSINYISTAAQS